VDAPDAKRGTKGNQADMSTPVVLITGAGSGIGRATAVTLGAAGWRVAIVGRRRAALEETAGLMGDAAESRVLVLAGDVSVPEHAAAAVEETVERFGRLDALVNNAGVAPLAAIDKTTPEMIEECFGVNAIGPANLIAAAWGVFRRQAERAKSGGEAASDIRATIVNVSSMATQDPFAGFFAYAAAKASVNMMAVTCAKEGKAIGVRAFAVAPGAVETPMLRANFGEKVIPRGKALAPEDVARVIVSCVMGERDTENGKVIWVASA
jgi:NAD(P)-dependent dehydrogenase (short-subunit alcohol dehydrogenase family)